MKVCIYKNATDNRSFISEVKNDIYAELKIIHQKLDEEMSIRQRLEEKIDNQDVENQLLKERVSSLERQLGDLRGSQSTSMENHINLTHTKLSSSRKRIIPGAHFQISKR